MELIGLTVEQQFKLKVLENHIQGLSQEQTQKLLLLAVQQGMVKDNIIKCYPIEGQNSLDINQLKSARMVT